jgi:GntR family transcriptional regulator
MLLHLNDQSTEPLHGQITRQVRAMILKGIMPEGEPLMSIRALAREQRVSVITVKRAYEDLEKGGMIHARRGKGFFVSTLSSKKKETMSRKRLADALGPVLQSALSEGLDRKQIYEIIQTILNRKATK